MAVAPERRSMEYKAEELIPLVSHLIDKYTSKESSSVSYEVAQMLMEAVLYCIRENSCRSGNALSAGEQLPAITAYQAGYEAVVDKVYQAKGLYERLCEKFQDYSCTNYRETILKGMPQFFLRYDARFSPQDHLLSLDYPPLYLDREKCGIDLIYEYLQHITLEKEFLDLFPWETVKELVRHLERESRVPYMGNICELALYHAVGCFIADCPLSTPALDKKQMETVRDFFLGDSLGAVETKAAGILKLITASRGSASLWQYLGKQSHDIAVRIKNGLDNESLSCLFTCSEHSW